MEKVLQYILIYFLLLIFMLFLDYIWLKLIANDLFTKYFSHIGRFNKDGSFDVIYWAAIFVYLLMALAVLVFIVPKSPTYGHALAYGAFMGLIIFGVYEGTNLSFIKDYSLKIFFADIVWGIFLLSTSSSVALFLTRNIL